MNLLWIATYKYGKRNTSAVIGKQASSVEVAMTRRSLFRNGPHQPLGWATHPSISICIQIGKRRDADRLSRCWFACTLLTWVHTYARPRKQSNTWTRREDK